MEVIEHYEENGCLLQKIIEDLIIDEYSKQNRFLDIND